MTGFLRGGKALPLPECQRSRALSASITSDCSQPAKHLTSNDPFFSSTARLGVLSGCAGQQAIKPPSLLEVYVPRLAATFSDIMIATFRVCQTHQARGCSNRPYLSSLCRLSLLRTVATHVHNVSRMSARLCPCGVLEFWDVQW